MMSYRPGKVTAGEKAHVFPWWSLNSHGGDPVPEVPRGLPKASKLSGWLFQLWIPSALRIPGTEWMFRVC